MWEERERLERLLEEEERAERRRLREELDAERKKGIFEEVARRMSAETVALIAVVVQPISLLVGALLGSYLQRRNTEREIRYARLHERRIEAVAELHRLVVGAERAFPLWATRADPEHLEEQGQKWLDAMAELDRRYKEQELWLDEGSRRKLEGFLEETTELAHQVGKLAVSEELPDFGVDSGAIQARAREDPEFARAFLEGFDRSVEARKRISADLKALRGALADEFRRLVGAAGPPAR